LLFRLKTQTQTDIPTNVSLEDTQVKLKTLFQEYKALKAIAAQSRITFIEGLAEAMTEKNGIKKEEQLKALLTREQQRHSARKK